MYLSPRNDIAPGNTKYLCTFQLFNDTRNFWLKEHNFFLAIYIRTALINLFSAYFAFDIAFGKEIRPRSGDHRSVS